jgi:endonuclease YncB( thermonuclease family)
MPRTRARTLTKSAYASLRDDIASLLATARENAKIALARELASAYWHIGKRLASENLPENAGYRGAVLADLSADLDLDPRTLRYCLAFHRAYPRLPRTSLTWAHFRRLLPLKDPDERAYYEQLAVHNALTVRQLSSEISRDSYALQKSAPGKKPPRAKKLRRPTTPRYTYRATVEKVIDGDTVDLHLDLGFKCCRIQRIRLAGLDAPPLDTPGGKAARDFVLARLVPTDRVLVKTQHWDIHGRYIGHIFYSLRSLPTDQLLAKGDYLNQQLLDRGLARPV